MDLGVTSPLAPVADSVDLLMAFCSVMDQKLTTKGILEVSGLPRLLPQLWWAFTGVGRTASHVHLRHVSNYFLYASRPSDMSYSSVLVDARAHDRLHRLPSLSR